MTEQISQPITDKLPLRVVYMGTPDFALEPLQALYEHTVVVGVVTMPDAPRKRGKALVPSQVKQLALELGIQKIIETTSFNAQHDEAFEELAALAPDVIVVAAFGAILPERVLMLAPHGCINIHASLLPRWRGAAPIQRAILADDEVVGVSIMQMETGLDTGPFAATRSMPALNKNTAELTEELSRLGAEALIEVLQALVRGPEQVVWCQQPEEGVTYAHKIKKSEVLLNPYEPAENNVAYVRASSDAAPARLTIAGTGARITRAHVSGFSVSELCPMYRETHETADFGAGVVIHDKVRDQLLLVCGPQEESGDYVINIDSLPEVWSAIVVDAIKPDGKREMTAQEWMRGINLSNPRISTWSMIS